MSTEFINLSEIYLPTAGGSIDGDIEVGGAITVNDGSGAGTNYDVAYEISQLRAENEELKAAWDSVSPYKSGEWLVAPLGNGYVQISRNVTHTSVSITNLWGAGIYESTSSYGNLAFPFTFAEQPAMNICVVGTSSYAVMGIETPFGSYSLSKTNTGGWYYYRPDNYADGIDITVSIIVVGKVS